MGAKPRMFVRSYIFLVCLFFLSGCVPEGEPALVIVGDNSANRVKRRRPPAPPENTVPVGENVPRDWVPPSAVEKPWSFIILHHSGTETGNMALIDREHRKRFWDGIGYDFLIGNGTDSGDGEVEVTFRWREQRTGAHCKTPGNWANERGIGICLVGNFEESVPTSRQIRSLVKLVQFLQKRYRIPKSRIYGHQDTPGARVTDCPGRNFSVARFKSML